MNFFGIDHQGPLKILREIREQLVHEPGLVPLVRQGFYFEDGAVRIKDPDADFFRFQGDDVGGGHPGESGSDAGALLDRKGEVESCSVNSGTDGIDQFATLFSVEGSAHRIGCRLSDVYNSPIIYTSIGGPPNAYEHCH